MTLATMDTEDQKKNTARSKTADSLLIGDRVTNYTIYLHHAGLSRDEDFENAVNGLAERILEAFPRPQTESALVTPEMRSNLFATFPSV